MKEQVYIKSYEDNSYIGVEFDEKDGFTSEIIPGALGKLSKMDFNQQMQEIKKFPISQLRLVDSEEELEKSIGRVIYTHVIDGGSVYSYNRDGDII